MRSRVLQQQLALLTLFANSVEGLGPHKDAPQYGHVISSYTVSRQGMIEFTHTPAVGKDFQHDVGVAG
eukprot:11333-Eustigmatos_ZCMA.PRE.1